MALTEEALIDHRFGRFVNNSLGDYHVSVHADVPAIETIMIDKPDPIINPMGAKGMGEIALIRVCRCRCQRRVQCHRSARP